MKYPMPAIRLAALTAVFACVAMAQDHRAQIAVEDSSELPGAPQVLPLRASMPVGECIVFNVSGNGAVTYRISRARAENEAADGCRVTIRLAGYRTTDATLTEGSTVVLKRLGDHEGSSVSFTSLKAPKDARKAYERGLSAASRQKYEEAAKAYAAAVAAYPEYAQAWYDLGLAQAALKRPADARASWESAVKCDPRYLKPYVQLARQAVAEGRNEDALAITNRSLEFNPVEFPAIYFFNAVAHFNLKHYDAAEKGALQTIAHDSKREIPLAESLLASALAAQGHLDTAIDHFRKYLELSPNAPDAAKVRAEIADLERRGMEMK
jgi:tetratricopeptide (TPR) repeat protein